MEYQSIATAAGRVWSTLSVAELAAYVGKQCGHLFPDGRQLPAPVLEAAAGRSLEALSRCFSRIAIAGYTKGGDAVLSHLHGDRYAVYLALLARDLYLQQDADLASRIYLLNKALHGLDLFYEVALPEVFLLVHPVGTVIGRARLGNFLCVYQNCTIGGNPTTEALEYPRLGNGTVMFAKSSLIGRCDLGDRVVLGAGAMLVNQSAPAGSLVVDRQVRPDASSVDALVSRFFLGFEK